MPEHFKGASPKSPLENRQPDENTLRKRVMTAIRSYGYSKQEKADVESRTDGVMIVLGEYVLPFLRQQPEREAVDLKRLVDFLEERVNFPTILSEHLLEHFEIRRRG